MSKTFTCKYCGREYTWERKKGHTKTTCNSCIVNRTRKNLKRKLVEYKGGKCQRCGWSSDKYFSVFDFHHENSEEKDFSISGRYCKSYDKLKKEVDKCLLLCSNCHRIIHEQERQSDS